MGNMKPCWRVLLDSLQLVPDFLTAHVELVSFLQVHPELRAGAEELPQAESGIGRDVALAVDDLVKAVVRHAKPVAKLHGGHADFLQLIGENLAGVYRRLPKEIDKILSHAKLQGASL